MTNIITEMPGTVTTAELQIVLKTWFVVVIVFKFLRFAILPTGTAKYQHKGLLVSGYGLPLHHLT
ncbi:MAG: hypothetical protein IKT00_13030 [Prevotella sp.]|nr:hypothetical protein [Prevotella sp.]